MSLTYTRQRYFESLAVVMLVVAAKPRQDRGSTSAFISLGLISEPLLSSFFFLLSSFFSLSLYDQTFLFFSPFYIALVLLLSQYFIQFSIHVVPYLPLVPSFPLYLFIFYLCSSVFLPLMQIRRSGSSSHPSREKSFSLLRDL